MQALSILPTLKNTTCIEYNFNYIHDYDDFLKNIINPISSTIDSSDDVKTKLLNTADYMFNVVGYGVFVSIKDNKVSIFQPFANIYKTKPGSETLTKKDLETFTDKKLIDLELVPPTKPSHTKPYHTITQNNKQWGFSDCIFFFWNDWWKDIELYLNIYFHMLTTICSYAQEKEQNIVDTFFFINLFDQPVAVKKKCRQYINQDTACKGQAPLDTSPFIQIFSGATSDLHFDTCMVYADAWEIATQQKFHSSCRDWYFEKDKKINKDWGKKNNMITFRGRNSSCYPNDEEKNDRLKVIKAIKKASTDIEKDIGLSGVIEQTIYLDGKLITSEKAEIKKIVGDFSSVKSMEDQSNSKFIVDIDGYVTPWRLVFELSYCSVILLFKSKYRSWFYDKLIHLENIYIIDMQDTSNFEKNIDKALTFFLTNDDKCRDIGKKAGELFKELSSKDKLSEYMIGAINNKDFLLKIKRAPYFGSIFWPRSLVPYFGPIFSPKAGGFIKKNLYLKNKTKKTKLNKQKKYIKKNRRTVKRRK
jgi:hypothetical protein